MFWNEIKILVTFLAILLCAFFTVFYWFIFMLLYISWIYFSFYIFSVNVSYDFFQFILKATFLLSFSLLVY